MARMRRAREIRIACLAAVCALAWSTPSASVEAAPPQAPTRQLPELTGPVNDFADVIDGQSASALERVIRELQAKTGDVIVVATTPSLAPYGEIRAYAVKLFENNGRGIGDKGKDNGLLILLAPTERRVWIEVGYGLEEWITDGFAGETSRDFMAPEFRQGRYGAGLLAGATRIAGRIAQGRNVELTGVEPVRERRRVQRAPISIGWLILFFILIMIVSRVGGGPGRSVRRWGRDPWSGWSSGVGPFGGGFGGGRFGGGGFGGGFGGFGGGRSGGGGGGSSW